jgi:hypothetical protein
MVRSRVRGPDLFAGVGDADDAAGNSATGVADGLASVVDFRVNDDGTADEWVLWPGNGDIFHGQFVMGFAVCIGLEVAEVASVAVLSGWEAVLMAFRVVMAAGAGGIGRGAVAELVDVEGMLLVKALKMLERRE